MKKRQPRIPKNEYVWSDEETSAVAEDCTTEDFANLIFYECSFCEARGWVPQKASLDYLKSLHKKDCVGFLKDVADQT